MPKLDGIGLAENLIFQGYVTPIILMTGNRGSEILGKHKISPMGIIYKPFKISELLDMLGKVELKSKTKK